MMRVHLLITLLVASLIRTNVYGSPADDEEPTHDGGTVVLDEAPARLRGEKRDLQGMKTGMSHMGSKNKKRSGTMDVFGSMAMPWNMDATKGGNTWKGGAWMNGSNRSHSMRDKGKGNGYPVHPMTPKMPMWNAGKGKGKGYHPYYHAMMMNGQHHLKWHAMMMQKGAGRPTTPTVISRSSNVPTPMPTPFPTRAPTPAPTAAPTLMPVTAAPSVPLIVERPRVDADISPVCLDDGTTTGYAVHVDVQGAGGIGGTRTVPIEVVFALDSSGSMQLNDPFGHRQTAAIDFVRRLDSSLDYGSVVSFDDFIDFATPLTNDFGYLESQIQLVDSDGLTDLDVGLREAVSILDASQLSAAARAVIFLTDGEGAYTYCNTSRGPANDAANKGYRIYSVGLSSAASSGPLIDMSECTSATYTPANSGVDLTNVFQEFLGEVLESTAPLDVTLTLVLQPGFRVVSGSVTPPADQLVFDSVSDRTTLVWERVDNGRGLATGDSFEVNFNVTAVVSGSLTDQLDSGVTFSAPDDAIGEVKTPELSVDIESATDVCVN